MSGPVVTGMVDAFSTQLRVIFADGVELIIHDGCGRARTSADPAPTTFYLMRPHVPGDYDNERPVSREAMLSYQRAAWEAFTSGAVKATLRETEGSTIVTARVAA